MTSNKTKVRMLSSCEKKVIKIFLLPFLMSLTIVQLSCTISKYNYSASSANYLGDTVKVSKVPRSLGLDAFYKKYLNANGIPVVSSDAVPDTALIVARSIVIKMLAKLPKVNKELARSWVRVSIMSENEQTTDLPEYRNQINSQVDLNKRGRGYGATPERPVTSCAEENLLCYSKDRYRGENILIHEFAHTIHAMGLKYTEVNFDTELEQIYDEAKQNGLWKNTYAISNVREYWAEGVQTWFNANFESIAGNGIHNEINTREELRNYDPKLYSLISRYFKAYEEKICCSCR